MTVQLDGEDAAKRAASELPRLRVHHFLLLLAVYSGFRAIVSWRMGEPTLLLTLAELSVLAYALATTALLVSLGGQLFKGRPLLLIDGLVAVPWSVFCWNSFAIQPWINLSDLLAGDDLDGGARVLEAAIILVIAIGFLWQLFLLGKAKPVGIAWKAISIAIALYLAWKLLSWSYGTFGGKADVVDDVSMQAEMAMPYLLTLLLMVATIFQVRSGVRISWHRWMAITASLVVCCIQIVIIYVWV